MTKTLTVQQFYKRFPDDDACLDHLMNLRFGEAVECPKCKKTGKFHRIRRHPAYECAWCGFEIFPMVGTIFHRSHTPLWKWFYAMYLFTTTRHGVAAKELERQLGVSYPTALRMAHLLRDHIAKVDGDPPLTGHVEIDETYVGGKRPKVKGFTGRSAKGKTVVMGIMERGGEVFTQVVPNASRRSLLPHIKKHVKPGTRISTDEWQSYRILGEMGYDHRTVDHSAEQWADGDTHVNSLEGFWSQFKRAVKGTHVSISQKYMHKYLGEFEYRYNMRKNPTAMLDRLLAAF